MSEPFADNVSVVTVDGLSIENGQDEIMVHGSLVLSKDRLSQRRAQQLADYFASVAEALSGQALPEEVAETVAPLAVTVPNPFA